MSFKVRDCALISRMAGIPSAVNLRELRERIAICPDECLFHFLLDRHLREYLTLMLGLRRGLSNRLLAAED